ncbi:hypothetical protein HU675_0042000 [Bradyrhizobium septentrionale]|uniref:hypothetical protein n=1 Tax=Bradyrhizobium septentrionale TaxID=1404411 RepID=UPI001596E054|nr:hypothetical protein [Bradyrhizobium septentrionale]UGY24415.1 hypothetical protein HU675_0042000 [Bradyrhizobium septentrionale]
MRGSKSERGKIIKPHLHGGGICAVLPENNRGSTADAPRLSSRTLINPQAGRAKRLRDFSF